jgi:hypothetical protein
MIRRYGPDYMKLMREQDHCRNQQLLPYPSLHFHRHSSLGPSTGNFADISEHKDILMMR